MKNNVRAVQFGYLFGFLSKVIDVLRGRGLHIEARTEMKRRRTSVPLLEFEHTIPVLTRAKRVCPAHRVVTVPASQSEKHRNWPSVTVTFQTIFNCSKSFDIFS
jgi:hypothetical protein